MATSTLSEEEFHRMQLQLIELRTSKYELEATSKKQEREILALKEVADNAEKELQKAQKAINKSKKAKEVELLLQEADNLQMKLQSQEEDFRLQNQTLMQELSKLVANNEELEKQISKLKSGSVAESKPSGESSQLEDEVVRLQAQNAALQKSLSEHQLKSSSEAGTPDSPQEECLDNMSEPVDDGASQKSLQKTIDDLKLNLATESEEKKILKQKLTENEEKYFREVKELKEEMEKVSDKLKKKQESYLQLQEEKEKVFKEKSVQLEELQASKDRDQKYYTDKTNKLQQEIARYQRLQDDIRSNSDQSIKQLQNKMAQMQQQIDAADIIENQHLQEKTKKFESQTKELQSQILVLTQRRDDLSAQLEESERAREEACQRLLALQKDRDQQIQTLQEANKLAEKRKAMLDELAIKYQKDCDKHREEILKQEDDYDTKLKSLQQRLDQEQKKNTELEKLKPIVEDKESKLKSLEEKCGWLERKLSETEGSLDKTLDENETTILTMKTDHEEEISALKLSHSTEVENLTATFQTEINSLKDTIESQKQNITSLQGDVKKLKQDIKDGINDKKVHEKKGKSVLKDLKKQLHAERTRAEKLQERLQEVLSTGSNGKSIDDLFRPPDVNDSWREDQSSVSSWSGVGTLGSYNTSIMSSSPQSPLSPSQELPHPVSKTSSTDLLESENKELLGRLAVVQQEKWDLEEKVRHLETSTAAMANDLIDKSKIIGHYVMESRTDTKQHNAHTDDKITLKKVLDLVNKSDEHGLREMNKKLQNMLEETLTKNMHLQKDLETMSQEVVRLSKMPHWNTSQSQSDSSLTSIRENIPKIDTVNSSPEEDGKSNTTLCSAVNGVVS